MLAVEQTLHALADQLRADGSVISPHVADPDPEHQPSLGRLAAAGHRAASDPGEYALLIEAIREGYLLHYGEPRVIERADHDLALLAGDYLYARGLERLAALGDLEAIRELADLISLSAQLQAEDREGLDELWLASVTAVAAGSGPAHQQAKAALRRADAEAPGELWLGARRAARRAGIDDRLERAAESIGFQPE
jgi:hypothetical protein